MGAGCGVDSWRLIAERGVSSAVVVVRLSSPPRACPSQRSGLYRAQRFRAIPTLSGAPHHREEVVQTLVVGMDLDVVAQGGGGIVESGLDFAEPSAQVLRQTSLVERASQIDYLRRRHDVGDVLDSRPGSGEAFLDALGRQAYGFDQLDRAVAAVAEGRVVNELRRLTAREDVLQRHALDEEERPGAELIDQAAHGRLDVLDEVGVMVRLAKLRSGEGPRHSDSHR